MAANQGFPQVTLPFIDRNTGIISQTWYQLLIALWARTGGGQGTGGNITTIDVPASGSPYTPPYNGNLFFPGGVYVQVARTRGALSYTQRLTYGYIPVAITDRLVFTYATTPTIYLVP